MKREYVAFHLAYQDCRRRMLRGETDVLWPPGTWAMVRHFGQRGPESGRSLSRPPAELASARLAAPVDCPRREETVESGAKARQAGSRSHLGAFAAREIGAAP